MHKEKLLELATTVLSDLKARDLQVLDVQRLTSITDHMVIASGTSDRHVRSMADRLIDSAKQVGIVPLGVEGKEGGEWVLVDLEDVVVHIMQPRVREFYRLEDLWSVDVPSPARQAE